jgi:hypothetical protein
MFTLAALEMPGGTRILDQRQNIAADDRIHFVPVDDATMEKAMDRMVDQIASMPTRERKPPRTIAVNTGPMQLFIVNVVVTAGIAVAILWNRIRRRERSTSVSDPAVKS